MIQVQMEADVPESRQAKLTLPAEVPVGHTPLLLAVGEMVTMNSTYYRPADPAVAAEFDSFCRLLPVLRVLHGGHYVAVQGDQVIASGMYLDGVRRMANAAVGDRPYYCDWVEPVGGYLFQNGVVVVVDEPVPA